MIEHPGRYQELAAAHTTTLCECDRKVSVRTASGARHLGSAEHDAWITSKFFARQAPKFFRRDAVTGQEAMHLFGRPTARRAGIAQQYLAPAPAQYQSGAQTGWTSASNDHVPQCLRHVYLRWSLST